MIVVSSTLVPGPSEASLPAGTPWIGWRNIVTPSNIVSTTAIAPVSNLANPSTYLRWSGAVNTGDEYITVTTGTVEDIDYLAVASHNFGSNQNVISVEGKFDPGGFSPPPGFVVLAGPQLLPDDAPVIFRFTPQPLTQIRLRIQPSATVPIAAVMYVGKLLVMERGINIGEDHVPIKFGRRAKIYSGFSEEGNFLGRVVLQQHRESKASFKWLTPAWYRSYLDPFLAASKTIPFFFAWNPGEYPLETGYAWMTNDPEPATDPVTRRVHVQLAMRGVA